MESDTESRRVTGELDEVSRSCTGIVHVVVVHNCYGGAPIEEN